MVRAIIFDYGGVLAEEGFREGLKAIARNNGLDPEWFFRLASDLIYETGYVTGKASETEYLDRLRRESGIRESSVEIRDEIFSRFVLRPDVIGYVEELRSKGLVAAILSDQTNWLDELNNRDAFFRHFDLVYNSFRMGKSKRDASVFREICLGLGLKPEETVFVDDNLDNIRRAEEEGLNAVLYTELEEVKDVIGKY